MGGSGSGGSGGGGGIHVDQVRCGDTFELEVVIIQNTEVAVWNNCQPNEAVYIIVVRVGRLPRMEVRKVADDFVVGLVPPSASGLINCIESGWKYRGKIIKKTGSQYSPEITVMVKGDKQ